MPVRRSTSSPRPVATGCGSSVPKKVTTPKSPKVASGTTKRTVATGCGAAPASTGSWKPKATGKSTSDARLSERSQRQLDKAGTGKSRPVSTGCGGGSKPAHAPTRPVAPGGKTTRTGC